MSTQNHFKSEFEESLYHSKNQTGFCITAVLVWLLHIDGRADAKEEELLGSFLKSQPPEPTFFHRLFSPEGPVRQRQAALHLALEVIEKMVERDRRPALLELMVAMSLADGFLTVAENHALRFLADVLDLGSNGLNQAFQNITGKPIPAPSNPSSRQWWETREQGRHRRSRGKAQPCENARQDQVKRVHALATLGLDDPATPEDIKSAYRRMCKVHHPDRFATLGDEAVQTANEMIRRIREAYEYLEKNS